MDQIDDDRISTLPNSIRVHILSLLNLRELARTTVLSKRWQYIWTFVPILTLEHLSGELVAAGVNKTLLRFWNTGIKEFKVLFDYKDCFASTDIDTWLRFAVEKKVRRLILTFSSGMYRLPQVIFCYSSLEHLTLSDCEMVPRGAISWPSLKCLTISDVTLSDDIIAKILSGSPMLEYLLTSDCEYFNKLDIMHKSLRELVIDDYSSLYGGSGSYLEISAPYLHSLHLLGQFDGHCRLINVSSLLQAELNFSYDSEDQDDDYDNICFIEFGKLLGSLDHVMELSFGHQCIQALLRLEENNLQLPILHLTCLKLNSHIDKFDSPGIIILLKCTPDLEKLVVNKISGCDSEHIPGFHKLARLFWNSERKMEKISLSRLKIVKFYGFMKWEDINKFTFELGQVLLENAELLEEIVIPVGEYKMRVTPRSA